MAKDILNYKLKMHISPHARLNPGHKRRLHGGSDPKRSPMTKFVCTYWVTGWGQYLSVQQSRGAACLEAWPGHQGCSAVNTSGGSVFRVTRDAAL